MNKKSNQQTNSITDIKVYEELGSGSFGKVYRAFDPSLGKVVAVKMIELDTSGDIEEVLLELKFLSELRCEQITRHFYAALHDSVLFVMMEYCEVGSCMLMLRQYSVFREESTAYVIHEILQGLQYIHGQNKIHRDLKSANILITGNCGVKIADFGVSAQLSRTLPDRKSFMGTPYWMAPEVIESSHYNTAVDIWSLGIVTFELITGSPPYRKSQPNDAMVRIVRNASPQLPNVVRGHTISKALCELTAACLNKDPTRRPSTSELLATKYMRSHEKCPVEFKTMVESILESKSQRYRNVKSSTLDDLDALAPPKSKHSRIDNCKQSKFGSEEKFDDFDFGSDSSDTNSSDISIECPPHPTRPSSPTKNLAYSYNKQNTTDANPVVSNCSPTPRLPVRLRPLKSGISQPQNPIPKSSLAHQIPQAKALPRRTEITSETLTKWMRKALAGVESRTKVPKAVTRIAKLRKEIEDVNDDFPGFTRAFIEELWRVIIENKHGHPNQSEQH